MEEEQIKNLIDKDKRTGGKMKDPNSSIERIGEFFVRIGIITPDQVEEVLKIQKSEPDRLFGEIAIELGYINDKALDEYIASKRAST